MELALKKRRIQICHAARHQQKRKRRGECAGLVDWRGANQGAEAEGAGGE